MAPAAASAGGSPKVSSQRLRGRAGGVPRSSRSSRVFRRGGGAPKNGAPGGLGGAAGGDGGAAGGDATGGVATGRNAGADASVRGLVSVTRVEIVRAGFFAGSTAAVRVVRVAGAFALTVATFGAGAAPALLPFVAALRAGRAEAFALVFAEAFAVVFFAACQEGFFADFFAAFFADFPDAFPDAFPLAFPAVFFDDFFDALAFFAAFEAAFPERLVDLAAAMGNSL